MFVETSGGQMYVEVRDGNDPPCVFIHGIPTNSYLWRNVRIENRAIIIDLIGYGKSEKSEKDLSVRAQAGYVAEALDELGVDEFYCVGHDIGGAVCQILAVNGENIKGMVLMDSAGLDYWPVPPIARLKDPRWDDFIMKVDLVEGFRQALMQGMVRKEKATPELAEKYAEPFNSPEGKMAYLRAARALDYRDTMKIMEGLKEVSIPALVLWGEEDVFIPYTQGRRLAKVIKGARFVIMGNVGHFSPEDDPILVSSLVSGFMRALQRFK